MQYSCLCLLPSILYPLIISYSQVLVFHVSLIISCALSRGGCNGTMLLVSQTRHPVKVQSEKAKATPLQSVWLITPFPVAKPGVILAEGAGATAYVSLHRDDIPVFLHRLACCAFQACTISTHLGYNSANLICKYLCVVVFYCN